MLVRSSCCSICWYSWNNWTLGINNKISRKCYGNGVELKLNAEVANIKKENDVFKIELKNGEIIEAKAIVNAAGVYADFINNMLSNKKFKITPRIGEYYLLDKVQGYLTDSVIFHVLLKWERLF